MSYQPPQMPGQGLPPHLAQALSALGHGAPNGAPPNGGAPMGRPLSRQEREAGIAQQQEQQQPSPLFGETPGEGYLYSHDPRTRQAALVKTTPEIVRDMLLRAIETCSSNVLLPFSEQPPEQWGRAALAFAQSYLLLDPSVDQQGVPVGAEAQAQAQASEGLETHKALLQGHVAAHASGQAWSFPVDKSGHPEPPRVKPNPAEEAIQKKNEPKEEVLKGARGNKPRPRPRIGS